MRCPSGAALGGITGPVRRSDRGRSVAPDVFRRLFAVAVCVPDGGVGGSALLQPGSATLVADDMLGPFVERASSTSASPGLVRRPALGPVSPGPAGRVDARPGWEDAREARRRRAGGVFRRGSSKACGRRGASSRSSISARCSVRCGEKRMPMRSRCCGGRCGPAKRAWRRHSRKSGRG